MNVKQEMCVVVTLVRIHLDPIDVCVIVDIRTHQTVTPCAKVCIPQKRFYN